MATSKILIKLLQEAVMPALVVTAVKLAGICLSIIILGVNWSITSHQIFPQIIFSTTEDYVAVSSLSNFFVFLIMILVLIWIMFKAHVLHNTHISPKITIRLHNLELTEYVKNTIEISHQAIIWLAYLWLLFMFLGFQTYLGYYYDWMFIVNFICVIMITWLFVWDIEREIELLAN